MVCLHMTSAFSFDLCRNANVTRTQSFRNRISSHPHLSERVQNFETKTFHAGATFARIEMLKNETTDES